MDIRSSVGAGNVTGYEPPVQQVTRSAGETINPVPGQGSQANPAGGSAPAVQPRSLDLKSAIEAGSKALQSQNQALEFQIDEKSHQSVVKVVDTQTNEVIRQMPSEEFLRMAESISNFQTRLLHEKV